MKELLTKEFWRDVKKTFDEARQEAAPNNGDSQASSAAGAKSKGNESRGDSATTASNSRKAVGGFSASVRHHHTGSFGQDKPKLG